MTGYKSKRAAAQDKLKCQCSLSTKLVGSGCQYCNPEYMDDDDAQPAQEPESCNGRNCAASIKNDFEHSNECIVDTAKVQGWSHAPEAIKAAIALEGAPAQPEQERNFCSRCGKRTADLTVIHTCTPPQEKNK